MFNSLFTDVLKVGSKVQNGLAVESFTKKFLLYACLNKCSGNHICKPGIIEAQGLTAVEGLPVLWG